MSQQQACASPCVCDDADETPSDQPPSSQPPPAKFDVALTPTSPLDDTAETSGKLPKLECKEKKEEEDDITPIAVKEEHAAPSRVRKREPFRWKTTEEESAPVSTPENFNKFKAHHKAGFDNIDMERIQQIIESLTVGTPHYERQKQKAKERHARMTELKRKVEVSTANPERLRKSRYIVDHNVIPELEFRRIRKRVRVCIDMDCYYVACERLDNPCLIGKPCAVRMGPGQHSILATSSYEARKFGVKAGMPVFVGERLCPGMIIVPARMERYMEFTKIMESVLVKYDPQYMMGSLDEAFLDITHLVTPQRTANDLVSDMRREVKEATGGLTASAGCAPNLMVAKIGADYDKPDGQTILMPDADEDEREYVISFMKGLPLIKVPGIGPVTEGLLEGALDFKVVGDIFQHRATIAEVFTPFRTRLFLRFALGIACPWTDIYDYGREFIRKGIGANRTFGREADEEKLLAQLRRIAEILERDCETAGIVGGRTFTLRLKTSGFVSFGRSVTLPPGTMLCTADDFEMFGRKIFMENMPLELRRIGMKLTKLTFKRRPKGSIKQFLMRDVEDEDAEEWKSSAQVKQSRECARTFFEEVFSKQVKNSSVKFNQASCAACDGDGGTQSEHALEYSCPICRKRCFKYITALNKHMDEECCGGAAGEKFVVKKERKVTLTSFARKSKPGVVRNNGKRERFVKKEMKQVGGSCTNERKDGDRQMHADGVLQDISNDSKTTLVKKESVSQSGGLVSRKNNAIASRVKQEPSEAITPTATIDEWFSADGLPILLGQTDDVSPTGLPRHMKEEAEPARRIKEERRRRKPIRFSADGLPEILGQVEESAASSSDGDDETSEISMDGGDAMGDDIPEVEARGTIDSPARKRAKYSCPGCGTQRFENNDALNRHLDVCLNFVSDAIHSTQKAGRDS